MWCPRVGGLLAKLATVIHCIISGWEYVTKHTTGTFRKHWDKIDLNFIEVFA